MSDNYLTVIPTDPYWQPRRDAADRAAVVLSGLLSDDDARRGLEAKWHDGVELVHCFANLKTISCPRCGTALAPDWWGDAVSQCYDEGFSTLMVTLPCCDVETSLNKLVYDLAQSQRPPSRRPGRPRGERARIPSGKDIRWGAPSSHQPHQ
ncbi:hypothetical protein [Streptomyces sp. NPDC013740]|uniref:hypothetical protein n=1 Tax=Streptomyces sp. NPDC013740 TaxID=3364867 RepID=UPI0036F77144